MTDGRAKTEEHGKEHEGPHEPDAHGRRVRPRIVVVGVLALAACAAAAWWLVEHRGPHRLEWAGTVETRVAVLGSRTGGRVSTLLVSEGDRVFAGQQLVLLDAGDLDAQRRSAVAAVDEARARLARVAVPVSGPWTPRAAEIGAAAARVTESDVALEKARIDAARAHRLVDGGASPRVDAENADATLLTMEARNEQQWQTLNQLNQATPVDTADAAASLRDALSRLDAVDVARNELAVRAVRAGMVETLDLRPGDILPPNAPAVTVVEDEQLYVRVFVPETQLGRVGVGQPVDVRVDSFPGTLFRGVVSRVASVGEFTPRNLQTEDERADQVFAVRVELSSGQRALRAGMAAFVLAPPEKRRGPS